MKKCETKV